MIARRDKQIIEEARSAAYETSRKLHCLSSIHQRKVRQSAQGVYNSNNESGSNCNQSWDGRRSISREETIRRSNCTNDPLQPLGPNATNFSSSHRDAINRGSTRAMTESIDERQGTNMVYENQNDHEEKEEIGKEKRDYNDRQDSTSNLCNDHNVNHLNQHNDCKENEFRSENATANHNNHLQQPKNQQEMQLNHHKRWKIWRKKEKKRRRQLVEKDYSTFSSNKPSVIVSKSKTATKNAFMCTFCGAIFSKKSFASRHEIYCIRNGVLPPVASVTSTGASMNSKSNTTKRKRTNTMSSTSTTSTATTSTSTNYIPMQGLIKLSPDMKKLVVFHDDALIKVVQRSRRFLLSTEQLDAQRQLAIMARDRSYYDMSEIRSLEFKMINLRKQRQGKTSCKRTIWRKVQNRLADAYLLIKEGDDDHNESRDKYASSRYDDEVKIDDDTIYINVVVKQCAKLINDELERKANQRWTMNSNKGEENEIKSNFEVLRNNVQKQTVEFTKFIIR